MRAIPFMKRAAEWTRPVAPAGPRRACILRQNDWYEPMVRREAEALAQAGFDVEVMCMRGDTGLRRATVNGVTVTYLPTGRGKSSKIGKTLSYGRYFILAAAVLTARHIRRPYAVVQANSMPDFLVFAAVVPKLLGSRVVAKMQEPTPELAETVFGPGRHVAILARIEQSAIRFADQTVTVTDQLKERYVERGAVAEGITVVLNCADPDTLIANWSPPPPPERADRFVLVCHGTIEDRYGQDTIIEAAHRLRDQIPGLSVVLTGSGSGAGEIQSDIARLGLQRIVRFEGWVSDSRLNEILYSADAGVVAQKASPYSHLVHTNKMMDYWIFGLPVIASRLRAVCESYSDSFIEYFEPGNADDLAAAIKRVHADPCRRRELARNGMQAQLRNGWGSQRQAYLSVFSKLFGDVSTGAGARGGALQARSPSAPVAL